MMDNNQLVFLGGIQHAVCFFPVFLVMLVYGLVLMLIVFVTYRKQEVK